jgi:mitotic-spindle organizing protein 1
MATQEQVRDVMDSLGEISQILNTGLDRETLALLVTLCEQGVNPEALAAVVKELRREQANLLAANASSTNS